MPTIRNRLRASRLYDLYWNGRRNVANRTRELAFYRNLLQGLRPGDLIFDVGANTGWKSDIFLRLGARIIAVEPDRTNQATLRETFLRLRLRPKPMTIIGKAVSDANGKKTFLMDGNGSALNTLSEKWARVLKSDKERFARLNSKLDFARQETVETVTLESLIAEYGKPFFVKIDVEGHELSVLRGLQTAVRYLSFEVNLLDFREEGLECVKLLNALGSGEFNMSDGSVTMGEWVNAEGIDRALRECQGNATEIFWRRSS
jgi:FkbM family methyltransferase